MEGAKGLYDKVVFYDAYPPNIIRLWSLYKKIDINNLQIQFYSLIINRSNPNIIPKLLQKVFLGNFQSDLILTNILDAYQACNRWNYSLLIQRILIYFLFLLLVYDGMEDCDCIFWDCFLSDCYCPTVSFLIWSLRH